MEFIIPKFLKAQHVSSGTPLIIRSCKLYLQPLVLYTDLVTGRCQGWVGNGSFLLTTNGHHICIWTRGCKYGLQPLLMSVMPLETCWAFKKLGIINSFTRLYLVGYFHWFILRCTDPWILNWRKRTWYLGNYIGPVPYKLKLGWHESEMYVTDVTQNNIWWKVKWTVTDESRQFPEFSWKPYSIRGDTVGWTTVTILFCGRFTQLMQWENNSVQKNSFSFVAWRATTACGCWCSKTQVSEF
jgi:hypothetical protein